MREPGVVMSPAEAGQCVREAAARLRDYADRRSGGWAKAQRIAADLDVIALRLDAAERDAERPDDWARDDPGRDMPQPA